MVPVIFTFMLIVYVVRLIIKLKYLILYNVIYKDTYRPTIEELNASRDKLDTGYISIYKDRLYNKYEETVLGVYLPKKYR